MRMECTCHSDKQTEGGDRGSCLYSATRYQKLDMRHDIMQPNTSEAEVDHLAGSAAGHALLVVSCQVEVCGTGTLVASSR